MQFSFVHRQLIVNWKQICPYAALFAAVALLLGYRLGSLLPGFSSQEIATLQQAGSLQAIADHPVNAPYLLLVHALSYSSQDYLLWGRITSAACGMAALALFCGLVWYWHGRRNALLGTALFGTSAWFLHTARLGTPDVTLFFGLALVAGYLWFSRKPSNLTLIAAFLLLALSLYIPGMVWVALTGLIWRWRSVDQVFKRHIGAVTAGGALLLTALVPLGLAIYHDPTVAKVLLGLPADGWPEPLHVLRELASIPYHLLVNGPAAPERWLGTVAVLDVFTAAMCFLGGYRYLCYLKLKRTQLTIAVLALGALLICLGGAVSLTMLVPFIYTVAAAGIGYMLDSWLRVFPRNGIAQAAGYTLIGLAMLSAAIYSLAHYFIAWPEAKATRQAYTAHRLPDSSDTIRE